MEGTSPFLLPLVAMVFGAFSPSFNAEKVATRAGDRQNVWRKSSLPGRGGLDVQPRRARRRIFFRIRGGMADTGDFGTGGMNPNQLMDHFITQDRPINDMDRTYDDSFGRKRDLFDIPDAQIGSKRRRLDYSRFDPNTVRRAMRQVETQAVSAELQRQQEKARVESSVLDLQQKRKFLPKPRLLTAEEEDAKLKELSIKVANEEKYGLDIENADLETLEKAIENDDSLMNIGQFAEAKKRAEFLRERHERREKLKAIAYGVEEEEKFNLPRDEIDSDDIGIVGRSFNPNTPEEFILPPVPPPNLSEEEKVKWLEEHPAPVASPHFKLLLDLQKIDEDERRQREEKRLQEIAMHEERHLAAEAGGGGGGDGNIIRNDLDEDDEMRGGRVARGIRMVDLRFETSLGTFDVELYYSYAPASIHVFASLVRAGFYDGLMFHRKIHNWLIQGGDPTGTGEGGRLRGLRIPNEVQPKLRHTGPGIIGMASDDGSKPNSQFYITLGPTPPLDGKYCILGRVSNGIEAIMNMAHLVVDREDRPQQWAQIYRAYIIGGDDLISYHKPRSMMFVPSESDSETEDFEVKEIKKRNKRIRRKMLYDDPRVGGAFSNDHTTPAMKLLAEILMKDEFPGFSGPFDAAASGTGGDSMLHHGTPGIELRDESALGGQIISPDLQLGTNFTDSGRHAVDIPFF